jgi:predicted nuclease of restriction endonuclease-like (RecB) superfamily
MRSFFMNFQIRDAVRRELSWTHYRLLLRVEKPDARSFFEIEAVNARWSTRELERQINSLLCTLSAERKGTGCRTAERTEGN